MARLDEFGTRQERVGIWFGRDDGQLANVTYMTRIYKEQRGRGAEDWVIVIDMTDKIGHVLHSGRTEPEADDILRIIIRDLKGSEES